MGNRGQKRADTDDELPADKRACSSLESRPSTSISPVRTPISSDHEVHDEDMDTSSSDSGSMRSEGEEEMERESVSCESERNYREIYRRRSSDDQSKFNQVLSSIAENSDESVQLASLNELCELLCFSMDISLSGRMADSFAPLLVKLARHQSNPDIMLLAIRALTYFCDAHPQAAAYLVRHDAVPALCQRLLAVEYLDVAEQCLRALEKISREQPLACLESGAILAVLNFIDFFSTVLQRTALSIVVNICKKLPSESPSPFMEAVPNLCNLLQYEDQKLVESAATCLINIAERVCHSPDMLDELCKHGLVQQVTHLIDYSSRTSLCHQIYLGLIQLLAKLASGSVVAVRTLFDINISQTLKDIVSGYGHSHGMTSSVTVNGQCIQLQEVLKLLNELLPAAVSVQDKHTASEKEAFITSQPDLLLRFGLDLLPVLIQVVNSGADIYVCYGCLSFINKLVYFSKSEMLLEILQITNISSFLAGVFTRKDRHVLLLALQIVDTVLQKHSNAFMDSFTKEGVFFAVNALLSSQGCLQSMFHTLNSLQLSSAHNERLTSGDGLKCLCFAFDADQTASNTVSCKVDEASIKKLAEHIKANFFATDTMNPEKGLTTIFHKLKTLAYSLTHTVTLNMENPTSDECEEELYLILQEIVSALNGKDQISTFEFVESGIVRSLLVYLSNGQYVGRNKGVRGRSQLRVIEKRFGVLGSLLFSVPDPASQVSPLSALVKRLQSSLASVETLPVILSQKSKLKSSRVMVPHARVISYPSLKVQFVKALEELSLEDYVEDAVNVDPFSTLDAIEAYMWSKVTKKAEQATSAISVEEESSSLQSMFEDSVDSKCIVERMNEMQDEKSCLALSEQGETSSACDKSVTSTDFEEAHAITETEPGKCTGCQQCTKDEESSHKMSFYLDGQELDHRLTLYQSIIQQQSKAEPVGISTSKLWSKKYKVMYRKSMKRNQIIQGHNCSLLDEPTTSAHGSLFSDIFASELASLDNSSPTYDIFSLLKCLEGINRFKFHLITRERTCSFVKGTVDTLDCWNLEAISVPQYEFVSSKMTGKLEQQMKDPMVVAIGAVPPWYSQLMGSCPYIFGYDARHKYFRFAALGKQAFQSHSIQKEESEIDHGRRQSIVHRKKFLVDRSKVLDSAAQMMNNNAYQKAALEVEYLEEVGTGLGPTLEFYTLVSHEFQKRGLYLWREDHTTQSFTKSLEDDSVLAPALGLFPRPWSPGVNLSEGIAFPKVIEKYILLGQIVGKALQDGRVLDLPFSKAFYKLILGKELTVYDIQLFDLELGRALLEFQALIERKKFFESVSSVDVDLCYHKSRVEDLCLEFTLPGYRDYLPDSSFESKMVDLSNLEDFISFVVDATIKTGISRQVEAFKSGLGQVFPVHHLRLFSEDEVERLLCGESEPWNSNELLDHIKFDHGFTATSAPILYFLQIMQEFNPEQKRSFLRFVTGAPRLPHGGLASLNPKLTVVRKHCTGWAEADLPSVMTCANYLKLPPYSNKEVMKEKLLYAIAEGQGSFHLS